MKNRIRALVSLAALAAVGIAYAALPATDAFTGTNGTALTTYSASWTAGGGAFTIENNSAAGQNGTDTYAYWNADSFAANQYAKANISSMASGADYRGVICRASGTGASLSAYLVYTDGQSGAGHTEISEVTAGTAATLKAVATTFSNGDSIEIRCSGTTIQLVKNNVVIDSTTDATLNSGAAGIYAYHRNLAAVNVDDFEGGNLGGGGGGSKLPIIRRRH